MQHVTEFSGTHGLLAVKIFSVVKIPPLETDSGRTLPTA
jgi:hypothetical protein